MIKPRMTLDQLLQLFAAATGNEELPQPIRQFAGQLTVLTAHLAHLNQRLDEEIAARGGGDSNLDTLVAGLAEVVLDIKNSMGMGPAETEPQTAITPAAPKIVTDENGDADVSDEETTAMVERAMREVEDEAKTQTAPVAPVTPLRKPNAGSNKAPTEEAS